MTYSIAEHQRQSIKGNQCRRVKKIITYGGKKKRITTVFSLETMETRRQ